jgi:ectoine hydroxylase
MLDASQIAQFERDGFLVIPSLFSPEEVALLRSEVSHIMELERPEIFRADNGEVRAALAVHRYSEPFHRLMHTPRLVRPTEQLLGGEVYCSQYKIVSKQPMGALDFPWHQDFANWHDLDGMPECRALNISVFLDEVTEWNGPVTFIPGSHKRGRVDSAAKLLPGLAKETSLAEMDLQVIAEMVAKGGLFSPKGPAGTAVLFHGLTAHASTPNISPWTRHIIYLTSNRTDNAIRKPTRAEYISHRDFTPLAAGSDDLLTAPYPAAKPSVS